MQNLPYFVLPWLYCAGLQVWSHILLMHTGRAPSMDVIDEEGSGKYDESGNEKDVKERENATQIAQKERGTTIRGVRPAPLELLSQVRMNQAAETPRSTIKSFLNVPNQNEIKFTKENLKKVEEQLKNAFIEFYHKLRLLKNYR